MKTIRAAVIDEAWQHVNTSSPDQARSLAERMQQEQPFIMVYLLAAEESMLDETERGSLLMLGATIWQIMSASGPPLRQVGDTELETAEEANIRALEDLESDSEMASTEAMQRLIGNYNQMPLLGAVVEALMDGHTDEPDLAPEHLGLALIHLKTVIDCLDQ
jgi:hypothetical protein